MASLEEPLLCREEAQGGRFGRSRSISVPDAEGRDRKLPAVPRQAASAENSPRWSALPTSRRAQFVSRQSAVTKGSNVEKAAALVDFAEDGVGLPPEMLDQPAFSNAAARYFRYQNVSLLWNANLVLLVLLTFMETPAWCRDQHPHPCGDQKKYHLGDVPYLPPKLFSLVELGSLAILAGQVFLPLTFSGWKSFWKVSKNRGWVVLFLLLALDVTRNAVGVWSHHPLLPVLSSVRMAPYLRVLVVVQSAAEVRKGMRLLLGVIPGFLDMATLVLLFLVFISWLAYILFEDTIQGETNFRTFPKTLYEMVIMMLTGNNWPDVWMPAFNTRRASAVFFIAVFFVGSYFLMSLLLAVVYDNYKKQLAVEYEQELLKRCVMLSAAFKLLDEEKKGSLSVTQVSALLVALNKYRCLPPFTPEEIEHIIISIDDSGDQVISEDEFQDLCTAIELKFVRTDQPTILEVYFPGLYTSKRYQEFRESVSSRPFRLLTYGVLLLNAAIIAVEAYVDQEEKLHQQQFWLDVEMAFGWVYLIELVLKLLGMGTVNYWRVHSNRFDALATLFMVATQVLILCNAIDKEWIRYVLIACILRLFTLLALVERYHVIMMTFFNLVPVLTPVILVTFCFMSIFTSMGVQLFGGKIYDGAPWLKDAGYELYMANNFNDFASGMVLVAQWLTGSLFSVWMELGVLMYGSSWIRLWFYLFLLLGNMFIMNIFVGFVFEAYYGELELREKGGQETRHLRLSGEEHGANIQVVHNNRFDRLMAHMLGGEDMRQKMADKGESKLS